MQDNTPFFCCRMLRFISNNTTFVLYLSTSSAMPFSAWPIFAKFDGVNCG